MDAITVRKYECLTNAAHRVNKIVPTKPQETYNRSGSNMCLICSLAPRNAPTAQMFEMENKEKHRANLAGNSAIVATPTVNASVKLNPLTKVNAMLHEMRSRSRLCKADMVSFAALVVYSAALDAAFALMSYAELA